MASPTPWAEQPPYGGSSAFSGRYAASCFCGRVRFTVQTEPLTVKICDCTTCARLHGAPMQWAALFQKSDVQFRPESLSFLRWYNTQQDAVFEDGSLRQLPCKLQCKHCGSWVADEGRSMFMAMPTAFKFTRGEVPECFLPRCRIFCGSRLLDGLDALPKFLDDRKTPESVGDFLRHAAPSLDGRAHKGQAGRIGVLGGSVDYAGAPYYAGMAALRVGAELLYLFTAEEATGPIKSYSPELMVSSAYSHSRITAPETTRQEQKAFVDRVTATLPRLHALCVGPGLGRNEAVMEAVAKIIERAAERSLPVVIDADGLFLVTERLELVRGKRNVVLTPNKMECARLIKAALGQEDASLESLCQALGGTAVVRKGPVDEVFAAGDAHVKAPLACTEAGAPRRPGGLGDLLSGTVAVLVAWAAEQRLCRLQACIAACTLVRVACRRAFATHRRALVAPDVLGELGPTFEELCPAASSL